MQPIRSCSLDPGQGRDELHATAQVHDRRKPLGYLVQLGPRGQEDESQLNIVDLNVATMNENYCTVFNLFT